MTEESVARLAEDDADRLTDHLNAVKEIEPTRAGSVGEKELTRRRDAIDELLASNGLRPVDLGYENDGTPGDVAESIREVRSDVRTPVGR